MSCYECFNKMSNLYNYTVVTTDTILSYIVNIKLIILHVKYQIKKLKISLALIVSSISKQHLACIGMYF